MRNLIIVFAVLITIGIIINIPVKVPNKYKGTLNISGEIESCEITRLGVNSSDFFLGIKLKNIDKPYLRMNPPNSKISYYRSLCKKKSHVSVTYEAIKRLVGPVRFWIDTIHEDQP